MPTANDRRIAKNAVYLYASMLLGMLISLYTVRVVFDTLGVRNYGIYNVVGGIVAIFGFLSTSMSGAVSRFLNMELGQGNTAKLRTIFATSLHIHIVVCLFVLLMGETVGLWYVNTRLVIEPERLVAANWTYQMSLLAAIFTIMQIPYIAAIVAHERMGVYALVSVANGVLKLGVAMALILFGSCDTLIVYACLMAAVSFVVFLAYKMYCTRNFPETRYTATIDKSILRGMLVFCGWDIYYVFSNTARMQGMVIILNRFGGTLLNAAAGITMQVSGALTSFSSSLIAASRPQIIQEYACGNYSHMLAIFRNCSRYCLLLMGLFAVPLIVKMDYVLGIWLVDPAPHTAAFCRLAIIASFGELLNSVCAIGIHATGRLSRLALISGTFYLVELPVMWFALFYTDVPEVIYAVHIVAVFCIVLINTLILKSQMPQFGVLNFWVSGILVPLAILSAVLLAVWSVAGMLPDGFGNLLVVTAVSSVLLLVSTFFAVNRATRQEILEKIRKIFHRSHEQLS